MANLGSQTARPFCRFLFPSKVRDIRSQTVLPIGPMTDEVQAMIFNSTPFYNEPSNDRFANKRFVEEYNRMIEPMTVRHAMLYWLNARLKAPAMPGNAWATAPANQATARSSTDDPIWGDVIRKHFTLKGPLLLETARKWEQRQPKDLTLRMLVKDFRHKLLEHGFIKE